MSLPKFNAEAALGKASRTYHGQYRYGVFGEAQTGTAASVLPNQLFGEESTVVEEDVAALDDGPFIDLTDESASGGDELGGLDAGTSAWLDEGISAEEDVAALDDGPFIDLTDESGGASSGVAALDDGLSG